MLDNYGYARALTCVRSLVSLSSRQFDPQLAGALQIQLKRMVGAPAGQSRKLDGRLVRRSFLRCCMPVVEVLKFGSSVLGCAGELHIAVDEIYRRWRSGARVLAAVSAFAPISAEKWTCTFSGESSALLVSTVSIRKVGKWTGQVA